MISQCLGDSVNNCCSLRMRINPTTTLGSAIKFKKTDHTQCLGEAHSQ